MFVSKFEHSEYDTIGNLPFDIRAFAWRVFPDIVFKWGLGDHHKLWLFQRYSKCSLCV